MPLALNKGNNTAARLDVSLSEIPRPFMGFSWDLVGECSAIASEIRCKLDRLKGKFIESVFFIFADFANDANGRPADMKAGRTIHDLGRRHKFVPPPHLYAKWSES